MCLRALHIHVRDIREKCIARRSVIIYIYTQTDAPLVITSYRGQTQDEREFEIRSRLYCRTCRAAAFLHLVLSTGAIVARTSSLSLSRVST